eukprot:1649261-Rhodomonas_salina.1
MSRGVATMWMVQDEGKREAMVAERRGSGGENGGRMAMDGEEGREVMGERWGSKERQRLAVAMEVGARSSVDAPGERGRQWTLRGGKEAAVE